MIFRTSTRLSVLKAPKAPKALVQHISACRTYTSKMPSAPLPTRRLGKNGPLVPAMGFGLMGMSHSYGNNGSDEERFAVMDRAIELGETFWDSSDLYGDNEELIGKWFKRTGKRDQVFLATKFGYVKNSKTFAIDISYEYTKKACNESLKALGIETIDLYYVHNVNKDTPIEETMKALVELKNEGKIKYIGLSTISSNTLRRACKIAHVDAVQLDYSVIERAVETAEGTHLIETCRELGCAIVCAMPLGRGILTSTFSSGKALGDDSSTDSREKLLPRFQPENREKNVQLVKGLQAFADKKGCTITQLALAWLLKQGDDVIPIPGTKQIKYLEQNVAALDVVLSDAEEAEIRKYLDANEVAGGAVPEALKHLLFGETKPLS